MQVILLNRPEEFESMTGRPDKGIVRKASLQIGYLVYDK